MAASWAITGRSSHAAEEVNYRQKIDSHVDISLDDARDIAAATFETELHKGEEEVLWDEGESPGKAKDRTVLGVATYHIDIAPKIQPIMVEEAVEMPLPWGTTITGRMDVIDQNVSIRDSKHVSYAPREGEDWYQTQPGIYGWMYQQLVGSIPKFTFDYVILGRKDAKWPKVSTESVETKLTQERIDMALRRVYDVEKAIRSGAAYANASPWTCGTCSFKRICPYSAVKK